MRTASAFMPADTMMMMMMMMMMLVTMFNCLWCCRDSKVIASQSSSDEYKQITGPPRKYLVYSVYLLVEFSKNVCCLRNDKFYLSFFISPNHSHLITHTHIQVFIRLRGSRTPHLATKLNLVTSHNVATPHSCTNVTSQSHIY